MRSPPALIVFLVVGGLALLPGAAQAQACGPFFVRGWVFYPNTTALQGATVWVFNTTNGNNASTESVADGKWELSLDWCSGLDAGDRIDVNATLAAPEGTYFNETFCPASGGATTTCWNMTLQIAPDMRLIREQSNETGDGVTMTVRLVVYNDGGATMNASNVNVRDTFPSSWTVIDCGNCGSNNSTTANWTLGNLTADNFTLLTYRVQAPGSAGNHTFRSNVSWNYAYNASVRVYADNLTSPGHRVGVLLDQPLYEFDLDLSRNLTDVNRTAGNDTNYSARWSIKNIGTRDASAGSRVTLVRFLFNHSRWTFFNNTLSCPACDNVTNVTVNATHSALQANISSLAPGATANVTFTLNTSFSDIDETVNVSAAANNTTGQDLFFRARSIVCAIAVSANFTRVNWTVTSLPQTNLSSTDNNGSNPTNMSASFSVTGCPADLYIRANDSLRIPDSGTTIDVANEKFNNSTSDNTVTGETLVSLSTSYNLVRADLGTGATVFFKFFLDVPAGQAAGNYTNNVTLRAVKAGATP